MSVPSPVVTFPFDRDFQINVLALMLERNDFLLTAIELLVPEYFEDKILIWYFNTIKDFYTKHREYPVVDPTLHNELSKAVRAKTIKQSEVSDYAVIAKKLSARATNQSYTIDEVIRFCRRQAGRKLWIETAAEMDTADDAKWDEIIDKISKIPSIGNSYLDLGTNYFRTIQERVNARASGVDDKRTIQVGIHKLDMMIGGGLKDGQLGIWLGGTGRGKSIALCHCGKIAVELGYNVAHYTLELDERDVADRYDATLTQTNINELAIQTRRVSTRGRYLEAKHQDRLRIKHYPTGTASINTIKQNLRQLESSGWVPDLIIVDYGDLLKPLTNYNDEYADLGAIFKDLRGMAGDMKLPIWTATQSNRIGITADVIDLQHMSDSLKKAFIADVIIALCATQPEINAGIVGFYGAKNRNGRDKFTVKVKAAYETMTLQNLLETQPDDDTQMQATTASSPASVPPQSPISQPLLPPGPKPRRQRAVIPTRA